MAKTVKQPTKVKWNEIKDVGYPPKELKFISGHIERKFLLRGEYGLIVAYMFHDGSGFDVDPDRAGMPQAWAVIEGF